MYKTLIKKVNKGFTIIELLVVIVVLGILVLLAMPKFKDHMEKARLAHIKNDVKVAEGITMVALTHDKDIPSISDNIINHEKLAELTEENKLYDVRGEVNIDERDVEPGEYVELDKSTFSTKLKGNFYANKGDGKVYYSEERAVSTENGEGEGEVKVDKSDLIDKKEEAERLNPDDYEDFTDVENAIEEADKIIEDEDATQEDVDNVLTILIVVINKLIKKPVLPENYVIAKDTDFQWITDSGGYLAVNEEGKGYYKYVGNVGWRNKVFIPHKIKGNPMVSYYKMFISSLVEGVASDNPNVTNMEYMFKEFQGTKLELSSFDTKNVINMRYMFTESWATRLDLSNFNTSNVTDMYQMFYNSRATILDLSSFDTSNVTDMSYMLYGSQAINITGLSSFDTSNVTNMKNMFAGLKAATLDLSNFDTSNVTDMSNMFAGSRATTLDLSSFDTSKVTSMKYMFMSSQATTGYAKTQTDANKFNASSNKPSGLTFTVKQ